MGVGGSRRIIFNIQSSCVEYSSNNNNNDNNNNNNGGVVFFFGPQNAVGKEEGKGKTIPAPFY